MKKRLLCLLLVLILCGCTVGPAEVAPPAAPEASAPVGTAAATAPTAVRHPFALAWNPQGKWDPYTGAKSVNAPLLGLIGEGLYGLNPSFEAVPVLAQSATESEDGLTWRVKLREEVTFSDGAPLTAAAVVKLINAARGEGSLYQSRLREVENVTADGELTVVFTLSKPNKNFTALLDFPLVRVEKKLPVGTGAYLLDAEAAVLAPNLSWWRAEPVPAAEIALVDGRDAQRLMAALDEGRVTFTATDLAGEEGLPPAGESKSQDYPTSTMLYLGFRRDGGLCKDAGFCRALSQAVDRGAVVSEALGGHGAAASLPTPPGSSRYDRAAAALLGFDSDAAGEALDALGYGLNEQDGLRYQKKKPVSLTLVTNKDSALQGKAARQVSKCLGQVGVTVEVRTLGKKEFKKALENKNFDLYIGECRLTADGDLTPFYTKGSGLCFAPGAAEGLRTKAEEAKAKGQWSDFYQSFAEEPLFAPLCFKNGSVLIQRDRVAGATPTQGNLFYGFEKWRVA